MESVGIVAEYNPFHNGHLYQLQSAKKITGANVAIAVMSGHFLQRGEPALVSKWTRTKMALANGVDLVVELPYAFSVQKADIFAFGAIYLLNALHCNNICFGSEEGNMSAFYETYQFIEEHKQEYEELIGELMKTGVSYPVAIGEAFQQLHPEKEMVDLSKPNNILGYQYLVAARKINPAIELFTVKRKNANYHDEDFNHSAIASATSIRKALKENNNIQQYVPVHTFTELKKYYDKYGRFHYWEDYWPFLQYKLFTMSRNDVEAIYDVDEGLENRILKAARTAKNFHEYMNLIKTKRYTWTRLQRISAHILNNVLKDDIKSMGETPKYIRLLGMTSIGRKYLRKIKKELPIDLISKVSAYDNEMLTLDIKASSIFAQPLKEPFRTDLAEHEFNQPPILFTE